MASGGGSIESGEPEFQVAPMIDVLLTLLIFFMSITPAQVEQMDNNVKLPVAPDAAERKPDTNQRTVNLRWKLDGKRELRDQPPILTFNGAEWDDRETLAEELKKVAGTLPHPTLSTRLEVLLRIHKEMPAKDVQAAMQVIAQATAKIAFATYNK